MMMLKVNNNTLVKLHSVDQNSLNLGDKWALDCFGSFGRYILWVGLSMWGNGIAQVYEYNTDKGELRELQDKGVSHLEKNPNKLHRLGTKFYYTGYNGKLMSLSLDI